MVMNPYGDRKRVEASQHHTILAECGCGPQVRERELLMEAADNPTIIHRLIDSRTNAASNGTGFGGHFPGPSQPGLS